MYETCLAECKRRLDNFRAMGDDIQAALAEADMDRMLEELHRIYRRLEKGRR